MPDVGSNHRRWSESQILTRAAPTLVTEGMELRDIVAIRVAIDAGSGQTLSGAGSLLCYLWDNDDARWKRCPDLDLSVTSSGIRDMVFGEQDVPVGSGRILFATSGVTVSAGTTATPSIKGKRR